MNNPAVFLEREGKLVPLNEDAERILESSDKGFLEDSLSLLTPGGDRIVIVHPGSFDKVLALVHDARIILSSIMGYSELLEMNLEGENKDLAIRIKREADFLRRLFDDVVFLEKIKRGLKKPETGEFSICGLLNEIEEFLDPTAKNSGKSVEVDCSDFRIRADEELIFRALLNVVENALKHSKGDVLIEAHSGVVQVKDSGPKIVGGVKKRGFGLILAGEMVRKAGGELNLKSTEDGNVVLIDLREVIS